MTKGKKKKHNYNEVVYTGDNNIVEMDITESIRQSMLINGANVNYMRQVPDLRDGLKPVERRILYTMYLLDLKPNKDNMKCARIVGDVMAKLHPHGDSSIYDVLVRFTQTWNMYIPLAKDTGNFGTQYKNGGAAMRYTVTGLSAFAWDCFFSDFDEDSIFMRKSYDGKNEEPEYLPSKYPVGLILGTMGIASGYRVDIPQYNTTEVLKLAIQRLKNPEKKVKMIYPDSVTYSDVVESNGNQQVFDTGSGVVRYRGKIDIDYDKNCVYVYCPPIRVYLDKVNSSISELVKAGLIKGMINSRRYVVKTENGEFDAWQYFFKKDVDLDEVRRIMFKRTRMDDTLPVNFLFLDDFKEIPYSVTQYIDDWIDLRREYKYVRYTKLLRKTYEQMHTLETILMIFDGENGPKVVKRMQSVESKDAQKFLMDTYGISSLQARTITQMSIGSFNKDKMKAYHDRLPILRKEKKNIEKILASNEVIDLEIIEELEIGINKYGEPRRSKVIEPEGAEVIVGSNHKIVTSKKGFIKKLPDTVNEIGILPDGDVPIDIIGINNKEDLLVIDDAGYIHKLQVHKLPNTELESPGLPVEDYIKMRGKVCGFVPKPDETFLKNYPDAYIVMVSRQGTIKKTLISEFVNMKNSVVCMKLDKGDSIAMVKLVEEDNDDDILVYTNNGTGIRYPSLEVKLTGRASKGIRAIAHLDDDDYIIGLDLIDNDDDKFLLCVTDKGRVKKCELNYFRTMKRDSKPLRIITLDDNETINIIKSIKGKEKFMVFMKQGNVVLNAKEVNTVTRLSKAIKTIPVKRGDYIIAIKEF